MDEEAKKASNQAACRRWREKQGAKLKALHVVYEANRKKALAADPARKRARIEQGRQWHLKYRTLESTKIREFKMNARKRGIEWTISDETATRLFKEACHYCRRVGVDHGGFVGIDRKDSRGSYSDDNVLPCCGTCNFAKRHRSYEDMVDYLRAIATNRKDLLQ
jgi:hypothetical protein